MWRRGGTIFVDVSYRLKNIAKITTVERRNAGTIYQMEIPYLVGV